MLKEIMDSIEIAENFNKECEKKILKENEKALTKVINETVEYIETFIILSDPKITYGSGYKTITYRNNRTKGDFMKLLIVLLQNYFSDNERQEKLCSALEEKGYKNPKWGEDRFDYIFEFSIFNLDTKENNKK